MSEPAQSGQSDQRPKHSMHFVPGEITLFIRHPPGRSAESIASFLQGSGIFDIDVANLGLDRAPQPYVSPGRVVTFDESSFEDADAPETFSLIVASTSEQIAERLFLRYIQALDARIMGLTFDDGLQIEAATPNWLSCGASENNGSGGPGARPVPAAADEADKLLPPELGVSEALPGACATVFILDTAPCEVDLKRAYRTWVEQPLRGRGTFNRRLDRLIGPDGALGYIHDGLRIDYAGHNHLLETANAHIPDHNYVMADHGLFVASVINEYAPGARLHLVEVLNPYGIGTLESIARGFAVAARHAIDHPCEQVLVNASLFLDVAQADETSFDVLAQVDPFWEEYVNTFRIFLERRGLAVPARAELISMAIGRTIKPLELVCDLLRRRNIVVAAAAGNDAGQSQQAIAATAAGKRPKARFPAAYNSVLGVGARAIDGKTASYSNEPDRPPKDGVEAFGGDANGELANANAGALGVYIGSFPDRRPNQLGLARWAGTSFATPLITASLAAVLCAKSGQQRQPGDKLQRVKDVFKPAGTPTVVAPAGGNT